MMELKFRTDPKGARPMSVSTMAVLRTVQYRRINNGLYSGISSIKKKEMSTIVHAQGPPWDYKAFDKFDFALIGHFESDSKALKAISRFEHLYYTISVSYWCILLASILSGSKTLTMMAQFKVFVSAMCAASFAFTSWFAARCIKDVSQHLEKKEVDKDLSGFFRYGWRAIFWLAFVLFYTVPPSYSVTRLMAVPGAVMCLYGLALAGFSAIIVGTWSFMGDPNVPHRLITVGPYALLRHPQALGNMLFLLGFSLSGGAIASAIAFMAAFAMYSVHVIPLEEEMLAEAFPSSYAHYKERVPAFSWALVLLLVLEAVLIWRYGLGY